MYFSRFRLKNFGPFTEQEINFTPKGLNIIEGQNCTGKTQIAGAILATIIGKPAIQIHKEGELPAALELEVCEGGHCERIKLSIDTDSVGNKKITQTIESQSVEGQNKRLTFQLMASLSDVEEPQIFEARQNNETVLTHKEIELYEKILNRNPTLRKTWNDLYSKEILTTTTRSIGQSSVVSTIKDLLDRTNPKKKYPIIIDGDRYNSLDTRNYEFCIQLIRELAKNTQVIFFTPLLGIAPELTVKTLPKLDYSIKNAVYYNMILDRTSPKQKIERTKFILGNRLDFQEDRTCEFKEVKGTNPLSSIKSLADQYAVAFLNAGRSQTGSIYWGISDSDQKIIGVRLNSNECDELRRIVTEKLHQITPPIAPTAYRIQLHKISDGKKIIPELYIVEISVPSSRRTLLFATGSQEVYIKTDAGKKKLTMQEIQHELLTRVGIEPY